MKNNTLFFVMILFLGSLCGCGKTSIDYSAKATWEFRNESTHYIEINGGIDERFNFSLDKGSCHSFDMTVGTGKNITEESFISPYTPDYTKLKIDGGSEIIASGITDIKNYTAEEVADRHYKFTYTFTDADFPEEE